LNLAAALRVDGIMMQRQEFLMSRNSLYGVIAILVIALVAFGIYTVQQQQARPGIEVRVDEQGISIDGNG
jgi:hypothetical protein